jgi:hypothetical protein
MASGPIVTVSTMWQAMAAESGGRRPGLASAPMIWAKMLYPPCWASLIPKVPKEKP